MFDIGFWEICLIGIVGLLVIGPDRLPDVARTLGRWLGKAQRLVNSVKSDINRELEAGELRGLLGEQKKQIESLRDLVGESKAAVESSTREAIETGEKSWAEQVAELHAEEARQVQTDNSIMPRSPTAKVDPQTEDARVDQGSTKLGETVETTASSGDTGKKTA